MSVLIAGLLLFLGVHSVSIVNAPWRDRMAARLGEPAWQGLYGLVALAGFALIVWGLRARPRSADRALHAARRAAARRAAADGRGVPAGVSSTPQGGDPSSPAQDRAG